MTSSKRFGLLSNSMLNTGYCESRVNTAEFVFWKELKRCASSNDGLLSEESSQYWLCPLYHGSFQIGAPSVQHMIHKLRR
jgi:hypothetical protein